MGQEYWCNASGLLQGASGFVFGTNPPYYLDDFLSIYPKFFGLPTAVANASLTMGSTTIAVSSTSGLAYGQFLQAVGLPAGTVITGVGMSSITVNNGATATTGSPYYTENANDRGQMHDLTFTYDYMPSQFITFRLEQAWRYSDTPYWAGRGGVTPPGGNNGNPADYQCAAGGDSGFGYVYTTQQTGAASAVGYAGLPWAEQNCQNNGLANGNTGKPGTAAAAGAIWWPDLRTNQSSTMGAIMVRF